jgi:hypothetical protein
MRGATTGMSLTEEVGTYVLCMRLVLFNLWHASTLYASHTECASACAAGSPSACHAAIGGAQE